jgi:hypothetical protein
LDDVTWDMSTRERFDAFSANTRIASCCFRALLGSDATRRWEEVKLVKVMRRAPNCSTALFLHFPTGTLSSQLLPSPRPYALVLFPRSRLKIISRPSALNVMQEGFRRFLHGAGSHLDAVRTHRRAREHAVHCIFDAGLPYSRSVITFCLHRKTSRCARKLSAHVSCVNTMTFSRGDGRWLASGGDGARIVIHARAHLMFFRKDRNILLWDFHQPDLTQPAQALFGPRVRAPTIPRCSWFTNLTLE